MKSVYVVGEDPVTRAIVKRLIGDYTYNLKIEGELPARGGEIKKKIASFNIVAQSSPVVLLLDLDANDCAPMLKETILQTLTMPMNPDFVINIAVDEAEAWLFADKEGFASFLSVEASDIPSSEKTRMNGPHEMVEVNSPIKSSMYLTHKIALKSKDKAIREQLGVVNPKEKCKGKEYNSVIVPFVNKKWNVEKARMNSDSLNRMILRLEALDRRFQ